jgi:ribonuclease D
MGAAWRLNNQQLGVLRSLCIWREQQARIRNKPRTWISRDADLISLAETRPADIDSLRQLKDITRSLYHQDAKSVLQTIASAEPVSQRSAAEIDSQPLSNIERHQLKLLQRAVSIVARKTGIADEVLARKRLLIQIMRINKQGDGLSSMEPQSIRWPDTIETWRRTLLEEAVVSALSGKVNE